MNTSNIFSLICISLLLIDLFSSGVLGGDRQRLRWNQRRRRRQERVKEPRFAQFPTSVSALAGRKAVVPCKVKRLGARFVIWRRVTDDALLTIGNDAIIPDARFSLDTNPADGDRQTWNLVISDVTLADAGTYECQISTQVPLTRRIHLTVDSAPPVIRSSGDQKVVADALTTSSSIAATQPPTTTTTTTTTTTKATTTTTDAYAVQLEGERIIEVGKAIELKCTIGFDIGRFPEGVNWYHNGIRVAQNEAVTLTTRVLRRQVVSELRVTNTNLYSGGTYICKPVGYKPKDILIDMMKSTSSQNVKRGTAMAAAGYESLDASRKPSAAPPSATASPLLTLAASLLVRTLLLADTSWR